MDPGKEHKLKKKNRLKKLYRKCPICRNISGEILHRQEFLLPEIYKLPNSYDVVSCAKCGFVFADTPARQRDYDEFYRKQSKYENFEISSGGNTNSWDIERFDKVAADISEYIEDRDAMILDLGCANGGFLSSMKRLGYKRLAGLDPSAACVSNIRSQGFKAYPGNIFDNRLPEGGFDCIIISHVLEHVCDLERALGIILKKLKTNGLLYIEAPDSLRYSDYYKVPYYYFDCEHINHFSRYSLINLAGSFGLQTLRVSEKTIPVSNSEAYPVICSILKKTAQKNNELSYNRQPGLKILEYIEKSGSDGMFAKIKEFAGNHEEIFVWGAGSFTQRLMKGSPLGKCRIAGFIDKDKKKQGIKINGISVYPPERLSGFPGPVVICSVLSGKDIEKDIRKYGFHNRILKLRD